MEFEWDEAKSAANIRTHGVSFEQAKAIFNGPVITRVDDRFDYDELREISFGEIAAGAVLAVVHTFREEKIRIISARPATRSERVRYYAEIQASFDN